jgi:hypothetical protein
MRNHNPPAGYPFAVRYNNWGYSPGWQLFSYLFPDGTNSPAYWYNAAPAIGSISGYTTPIAYSDAVLAQSLDESTLGNPGIGVESACATSGSSPNLYQYGLGIGFYANPLPNVGPVSDGVFQVGPLESVAADSYGPRMFRPTLARGSDGYVPLYNGNSSSRGWMTWMFYVPTQVNQKTTDGCDSYSNYLSDSQSIGVSLVFITEI